MKELTNKEIKEISLRILSEVHSFCVSNDIKYSLAYGTLIGAVRHRGFIPWDDDIDIMMPREDYERFFRTFSKTGYVTTSPMQGNSYLFFGRVYDTKESLAKPARPQGMVNNIGVWIDVFPIDNVACMQCDYEKETKDFLRVFKRVNDIRFAMASFSQIGWHPFNILSYIKGKLLSVFYNIPNVIKSYDERLKSRCYDTEDYKGWISDHVYVGKERLPSSIYENYISCEFENKKFLIIENYDAFLRNFYGNYMQLPPKEKQIPPHSFHKFYKK